MTVKRIGYIFMIIGLLLPLYFFMPLTIQEVMITKTMQQTIENISELSKDLQQQVEEYRVKNLDHVVQDPFVELTQQKATAVIGYLIIPKISSVQELRLGATEANLELGVAHMTGTVLPGEEKGRTMIAGHRSRVNNLMFFRLNELESGDILYLLQGNRVLEYQVTESKILPVTNVSEILRKYPEKSILSLITCDPLFPPFKDRLVVDSEFVADRSTSYSTVQANIQENSVHWNIPLMVLTLILSVLLAVVSYSWLKLEWKFYMKLK